jgi:hypothetical protein
MTSDTQDLERTATKEAPKTDRVQLSPVQVAASALASVSAAVVASLFGVAGTVVGAGLVSIIATTGSALYSSSMKRTSEQLRRAREQLAARSTSPRGGRDTLSLLDATAAPRSRRWGRRSAEAVDTTGADDVNPSRWRRGFFTIGSRRGLRWPALAGATGLVFVLAIGAVTAFELIAQEPVSALTGHKTSSTTTLGSLGGGSKATPTPTPTPSASSASPGSSTGTNPSSASASASPSAAPRQGASATPQPSASASAVTPTKAPSTGKPQQQNSGGTGGGTGTTSKNG